MYRLIRPLLLRVIYLEYAIARYPFWLYGAVSLH